MKILAIETSCDETAVAVVDATESEDGACFEILADPLVSQSELHREYGGVYPTLAKREHAKNLVPLIEKALGDGGLMVSSDTAYDFASIEELFSREPELLASLQVFVSKVSVPDIDAIAVTCGPGLPPALWLGVNTARALAILWNKPLVGINHMEGHLLAGLTKELADGSMRLAEQRLPVLGLLISGGHTELVLMDSWLSYKLLGETKDDAVGEAFDKVARMLGLPYPGGPEISKLSERARERGVRPSFSFPRPMMHEDNLDFSFSGLKTSVMYFLKKQPTLTEALKEEVALEFENAVTEVLWKKTRDALENSSAKTLVIGGGVSANKHIRRVFSENMGAEFPGVSFEIPETRLTTDNALMIAIAGYFRFKNRDVISPEELTARSNLSLAA